MQGMELFECCKRDRFCLFNLCLRNLEKILNTTEADEARFDLCNVNSFFLGHRGGHAVSDQLLLQNQSSSAESAHANTEASVSGHCLDSSGKTIE